MNGLLLLAGDVQSQLNKVPSFDYEKSMDSLHPAFHLKYVPGANTVNFFGSSIRLIDTIGLLCLAIGFLIIVFASFEDNGGWKKAGYGLAISSWCVLTFAHFMIAGGMSYKTFIGHWRMAVMVFLSQVMIYAIPTILYYLGSSNLEFYELTSDATFLEKSQKQFRYFIGLEGLAVMGYVVLGLWL